MISNKINMKKFNQLFYKIILSVTLFFTFFMCLGAITNAHDELFANMYSSTMRFILPLMLAVMICMLIVILYRRIDAFSQKQLVVSAGIMFGIMALIFLVIFFNFRSVPYSDARNVQDIAMYFVKTGKRPIGTDAPHYVYIARYSNNYFLTIIFVYIFRILRKIGIHDIYAVLQILTSAGVMTSAVFMYLIGVKICGIRKGVKILALCVLNPIYYILALWVYTNVISIPFMTAVIYFGVCIYQEKRRGYLIFYCIMTAISSVIGFFIRPTAVIPLIAFIICAFLKMCVDKRVMRRLLKCAAVCLIAGVLLALPVLKLNDSYFSPVSKGNYPVTHWLMMGSHNDGKHNLKDIEYTKSYETKGEKTKATLKKTIENYKSYSLTGLVSFLGDKLLFSWGHGDGEEIILKASQDTKQTKLYSWIMGERNELFRLYCYAFRIANFFLIIAALLGLLRKHEIDAYQFVFVLSLFGGILFYCFWEVKGSYTAPFINIMLLIGMYGGEVIADKIPEVRRCLAERRRYPEMFVVLSCIACTCLISYYGMTDTVIERKDLILYCRGTAEKITADNEVTELSQEFYTSKPMNRIVLYVQVDQDVVDSEAGYEVKLLEEDKHEVYTGEFYVRNIRKDGTVVLKMKEIIPEHKTKYTLQFRKIKGAEGALYFQQQSNAYIDTFEGKLVVNGKERMKDMYIQVYKGYESKWCSKKMAFVINGGFFGVAFLMVLWMCNDRNIGIMRKGVKRRI